MRWAWLRHGTAQGERAPGDDAAIVNPATWASAHELIALRRHADAIALRGAGPARAQLGGEHLSRFRGRGMDYQESRIYSSGDDARSMDWRVTARTGVAHVKVYQEERERPVVFGIDFGAGMFFASRGALKSVVAVRCAALLAWSAAGSGDRVGASLFNGECRELAPRGGRHGVLQLIHHLVAHSDPRRAMDGAGADAGAGERGGLGAALLRMRRVSRPGSLIVLIGDFYGLDDDCDRHLQWLRERNDMLALQIVDPLEVAPPRPARYGVVAGGEAGVLDLRSERTRRAYAQYFARHHAAVAAAMQRHAIGLLRVTTDADTVAQLRRHFAPRAPRAPRRAEPRLAA